jgi:hypothetical protein
MILVAESNLFFIRKCKEDFCKLLKQAHVPMLTLSVKTSKDHPLPPPSPLRSLVSSFLLSYWNNNNSPQVDMSSYWNNNNSP